VGAGLTGIEVACELPARLRTVSGAAPARVVLVDRALQVGSDMGESARPVIREALKALGIETRVGTGIRAIGPSEVTLDSGERISTSTVVWAAGMRANPLTRLISADRDGAGRLTVDAFLRVKGGHGVFAAGDCAWLPIDGTHPSVMSCQHSRPMGRFAGHNAAADLLGLPMLPLRIDDYVTILDLGPWGAVYTEGWDRKVVTAGPAAKSTKREINCVRIYPPASGDRQAILEAAAPVVQRRPALCH
jgi:NADH:ubiquinone reductase (H+-translocating)